MEEDSPRFTRANVGNASNLIKRIREMADAQHNVQLMGLSGLGTSADEQAFPAPIRRQF